MTSRFTDSLDLPDGTKLVRCNKPANPQPCVGKAHKQVGDYVLNEYVDGGKRYLRVYSPDPFEVVWYVQE